MEKKKKKYDDITSLIFNTLHKEYESIIARGRSIDSRAGIFLTLLFTSFPFYVELVEINVIKEICHKQQCISIVEIFLVIFFLFSLIAFIIDFILFIKVLSTKKYKSYNNAMFKEYNIIIYEDNDTTINDTNVSLMSLLHEYIEYNNNVVTQKAKYFDVSLWTCFIYVALLVITIILKLF